MIKKRLFVFPSAFIQISALTTCIIAYHVQKPATDMTIVAGYKTKLIKSFKATKEQNFKQIVKQNMIIINATSGTVKDNEKEIIAGLKASPLFPKLPHGVKIKVFLGGGQITANAHTFDLLIKKGNAQTEIRSADLEYQKSGFWGFWIRSSSQTDIDIISNYANKLTAVFKTEKQRTFTIPQTRGTIEDNAKGIIAAIKAKPSFPQLPDGVDIKLWPNQKTQITRKGVAFNLLVTKRNIEIQSATTLEMPWKVKRSATDLEIVTDYKNDLLSALNNAEKRTFTIDPTGKTLASNKANIIAAIKAKPSFPQLPDGVDIKLRSNQKTQITDAENNGFSLVIAKGTEIAIIDLTTDPPLKIKRAGKRIVRRHVESSPEIFETKKQKKITISQAISTIKGNAKEIATAIKTKPQLLKLPDGTKLKLFWQDETLMWAPSESLEKPNLDLSTKNHLLILKLKFHLAKLLK